jgi:acetoin utilization deacetylase AcuC-like enzyme
MNELSDLIPLLYFPGHRRHHPLFEYDRGQQVTYQEVPRRVESAREALAALPFTRLVETNRLATREELLRVHSPAVLDYLQNVAQRAAVEDDLHPQKAPLYQYPWIYPLKTSMRAGLENSPDPAGCFAFDTYAPVGRHTWEVVCGSAALAIQAAERLRDADQRLVYALCRPPGHHAGSDYTGGYCYLNNAALAAQTLSAGGRGAILDIDYHHGNGTQDIFWQNPDIIFISLHADPHDEYPFFSGFAREIGGDSAQGATLNLPLPKGCNDITYLKALNHALHAIRSFQPNWLVLSAGYDTCAADPSTFFELSDTVYFEIGRRIGALDLPTLIVHEGGYAVEHNGLLAANLLKGFNSVKK